MVGWTDLPADLSDHAQIARLQAHLPEDALVVSSDLQRCTATAKALADGREMLPAEADLREIHFGEWEMKPFDDLARSDPERARAFWSNPGDTAPPGGESWNQVATRIGGVVDRLNRSHEGRDIIAVAHFGAILTQVQMAGGMTARSALSFKIDNLSVTRLDFLDPAWRIGGVNHLP